MVFLTNYVHNLYHTLVEELSYLGGSTTASL